MSLKSIHKGLHRTSRIGAVIGGLGILFIAVMITVDALMRKFLNTTLGGASEVAGFVFAVATALAYPFVLLDRANIRIDAVYTALSSKIRAFLDLLAILLLLLFVGKLTYSTYQLLEKSWSGGSKSNGVITIPLWIPQSLWVLGFAFFTVTAAFLAIYALTAMVKRDWVGVNRAIGVPSIDETIDEETHIEAVEEVEDQRTPK